MEWRRVHSAQRTSNAPSSPVSNSLSRAFSMSCSELLRLKASPGIDLLTPAPARSAPLTADVACRYELLALRLYHTCCGGVAGTSYCFRPKSGYSFRLAESHEQLVADRRRMCKALYESVYYLLVHYLCL